MCTQRNVKMLKKIIVAMLITNSAGSVVFGMEGSKPAQINWLGLPEIALDEVLLEEISDLDVNTEKGLNKALEELWRLRGVCRSARNVLTHKKIAQILVCQGLNLMTKYNHAGEVLYEAIQKGKVERLKILL